jgi:hypothetical protein
MDSVFGFSDLPVRLLMSAGILGVMVSVVLGTWIVASKMIGGIEIPGYAATVTTVLFFGALNLLGLGILGGYVWRTFENSKGRPTALVASKVEFEGRDDAAG